MIKAMILCTVSFSLGWYVASVVIERAALKKMKQTFSVDREVDEILKVAGWT